MPANVFAPLGMSDTRYLPVAEVCGPHQVRGIAIALDQNVPWAGECPAGTRSTALLARIAPTAHDGDTPGINPNYGHLLRGTVHDPTARRMGGVAGSAGAFSAVVDIGSFGHTGVTLWMDPGSDTYVIILANVIHQRGGPPVAKLSGDVDTVTARILGLYGS